MDLTVDFILITRGGPGVGKWGVLLGGRAGGLDLGRGGRVGFSIVAVFDLGRGGGLDLGRGGGLDLGRGGGTCRKDSKVADTPNEGDDILFRGTTTHSLQQ